MSELLQATNSSATPFTLRDSFNPQVVLFSEFGSPAASGSEKYGS
jgi:hypothetical protein